MHTGVALIIAILGFLPVVASADADRWDLDSFWRQQRGYAEKQGKRFVLDEIRRESLARSAEVQRLEKAIAGAPADTSLQAEIDYQRQAIENLTGDKNAIEEQIAADAAETREAMRAYKAKVDESTAQKKAVDMEKAAEWAHRVDADTKRQIEAAEQERRHEAKVAAKKRKIRVTASMKSVPPQETYTGTRISFFALRQKCRNHIQEKLHDWDLEFQHADMEEPYHKEQFTGWRSWYMRKGERLWFVCLYNEQISAVGVLGVD